jgi:hypothetical protein
VSIAAAATLASSAARAASPAQLLPEGRYRLEIALASRMDLPGLGEIDAATGSRSIARVQWRDGQARQQHRVCDLWDATGASWGGVRFPPAFVAALAAPRYDVALEPVAGELRYRADLGLERIGVADGVDRLPTGPADGGVRDFDGDGRPGATLRLRIPIVPDAELWVVQRARAVLDGRIVAPGRVEGGVTVTAFEQSVIGARPGFLRHTPLSRPDGARSRFRLERVAADADCDAGARRPLAPEAAG